MKAGLLFLMLALVPVLTDAGRCHAREKAAEREPGAALQALFPDETVRFTAGLLSLGQVGNRHFWFVADSLDGRDLLITTTLLKGSARKKRYPDQRYGYAGDRLDARLLHFEKSEGRLLITLPGQRERVVAASFDVAATAEGGGWIAIDELLNDERSFFGLDGFSMELGIGKYLPEGSALKEIRTFPNSVVVRFAKGYMSENFIPDPGVGPEPTRWEYGVSLRLLDRLPMRGREEDPRVGYFTVGAAGAEPLSDPRRYVTRWRLEPRPEDAAAYLRGEKVEPAQPIVYYIDPRMPQWLVPYVRRAVEQWQPAFEEAGFLRAIQAQPAPSETENPEFSEDNARYSCISYKATSVGNAYGATVADPRTGEILSSHIGISSSVRDLLQRLYFCQAGAVDSRAADLLLPDTLMGELVCYVVSHEVGHTLGLRHNFRGSSVFGTEQLRDAGFVRSHGHGASIMDYMRFNSAAQPEDGIDPGDLIPRIGPYDRFAVTWGYRFLPGTNPAAERDSLRRWVDTRLRNDSLCRYDGKERLDVLSQSEDLGNNQMEVNALAIANMRRLMKLPLWERTDEEAYPVLRSRYREMLIRYLQYADQVVCNIRGTTLRTDPQTGRNLRTPLSKQRQRQAMDFLDAYVFTPPEWLFRDELFRRYGIDERMNMETLFLQTLYELLAKLQLPAADDYPQEEFLADIRMMLFREWPAGEPVSPARRMLQRLYIARLKELARDGVPRECRVALWAAAELEAIRRQAVKGLSTAQNKAYLRSVVKGIDNHMAEANDSKNE